MNISSYDSLVNNDIKRQQGLTIEMLWDYLATVTDLLCVHKLQLAAIIIYLMYIESATFEYSKPKDSCIDYPSYW